MNKADRDRNSYFLERREANQMWAAKKAVRSATDYLAKKALFLEQGVHQRLSAFVDEAWWAIVDWELAKELRDDRETFKEIRRTEEQFRRDGEAKIKALEQFVRERFWGAGTPA